MIFHDNTPPNGIMKKVRKHIQKSFDVTDFTLNPVPFGGQITENENFTPEHFLAIATQGQALGFAYVGEAPSKTDTFDYLVLFNNQLVVKDVKVLIYREDYGGEIGSKRWLSQFVGKGIVQEFVVSDNIVAISGATISVMSMTRAINAVFTALKKYNLSFENEVRG